MTATIAQASARLGPMFEMIAGDGQLALDALNLPAGAAVLDVGTGAGNFAIFLAMQGLQVVTGEPADDATRYAGKDWASNAAALGVAERIRFQHFAAEHLPFADHGFDAVFFFGVLHHIAADIRAAVFQEALRVVKRGGSVVYFEPGQQTLARLWETDPDHPVAAHPGEYARGVSCRERKIKGRMMDIHLYRAPVADPET